jgi:predicted HD phosphohydrolase
MARVFDELAALYDDGSSYGGLSQAAHAEQAAMQAVQAGADDATVVAALLHDIGWKLAGSAPLRIDAAAGAAAGAQRSVDARDNDVADACAPDASCLAAQLGILATCGAEGATAEQVRAQHDVIGGTFLRMRGFCEKVPHLVEGHVLAKRYLCFAEAGYFERLSEGSKRTLVFQGGPMSAAEAALFESDPLFDASLEMRRWDEEAKHAGLVVPRFAAYRERVVRCLTADAVDAARTRQQCAYVREGNVITALRGAPEAAAGAPAAGAQQQQLVLLHVPRFSSSVVVAVIAEAALPVLVRVVGFPGELRSDAAVADATGGLRVVPCLRQRGSSSEAPPLMVESFAIVEFLLESSAAHFPGAAALRVAPGAAERSKYLSLLAYAMATVKPLVSNAIFLASLAPAPDTAAIAAAKETWAQRVAPFLIAALGDGDYFVAGRLTAVDIAMTKALGNAAAAGLLEVGGVLEKHYARMASRASHQLAYGAAEPGLYEVAHGEGAALAFSVVEACS